MHLGYEMCMRQEQHCKMSLSLDFYGMTSTIFPKVEAWLQEDGDHWMALQFVASKRTMEKYKHTVDFLVCEIFTNVRPYCMAYYAGRAPLLRDLITEETRASSERIMLLALGLAYTLWNDQRELSWKAFRKEVARLVFAT